MKNILRIFIITILSATALFSCKNENNEQINDILFKLESKRYFYDGVFATLDSISHLNLNKKQMAHYSLLKIRANWMAEIPNEQESDSLIEICLNYYKNSNDYYMKATAYFEVFRYNYEFNHHVNTQKTNLLLSALESINKAKSVDRRLVKYSELPNADDKLIIEYRKQWIMMGLAHSYQSIGHYDDVINVLKTATDFFEENGIDVPATCYTQIGFCYFIKGNDSCAYYCKKALDINLQTDDYGMISNSIYTYGVCFRNSDKRKALEIYKEANDIAYKHNIRVKLDAEIGQLYYELNDYDSAFYYTNRALQMFDMKDPYNDNLRNIYRTLFNTCRKKGDFEKAAEYGSKCISIFYKNREREEIGVAFENFRKEMEKENQIYAKKVKVATYLIFAVSFVAIVLIFMFLYQKMMRRKESERLSALQLAMQQKQNVQDNWLINNNVYKKATSLENGIVDKSLVLTDSDWKEFINITDIIYNGFVMKLKELHPSLTENDIKACCCSRYGFSDRTIAALYGIEIRSFKRHRLRITEKIGGDMIIKTKIS